MILKLEGVLALFWSIVEQNELENEFHMLVLVKYIIENSDVPPQIMR